MGRLIQRGLCFYDLQLLHLGPELFNLFKFVLLDKVYKFDALEQFLHLLIAFLLRLDT